MIVSLTRQFIFVHVPKNAGSSIQAALKPYGMKWLTSGKGKHEALDSFHRRTLGLMRGFRSFAVVRDPWDRTLSGYNYLLTRENRAQMPESIQSFEDYVVDIAGSPAWTRPIRTVRPQLSFITDEDGKLLIGQLLRFETLKDDFEALCDDWRIDAELPHNNRTRDPARSYREAYSDRTREIVARMYAQDIEQFGYRFDDGAS